IGITRVRRRADRVEDQERHKIGLKEDIHSRICAKSTAIMKKAEHGIDLDTQAGVDAVLNLLERSLVGHVLDMSGVGRELLRERLRAEGRREDHELRDVWPESFARKGSSE